MSIKIEGLTKIYGQQKAVDHITFGIKKGEIVGFIGPNGSGKSTTMKCICGILPPNEGQIDVSGIDVQKDVLGVKKIIGYLPENNPLYYEMYIREYLSHVAGYYHSGKARKNVVDNIIDQTGLGPESKKKIGQLSKGYKQRVGLAQALIHDPEVLILDEPTTGLDPNQIIEIRNLISGLAKDKTVLLSTHILQEVEAICDRVIILNKGQIAADSTSQNLKTEAKKDLQTIYIEFAEEPGDTLKNIPGIERVRAISAKEYILEGHSESDLRQTIFEFASHQGITLLTIQRKEETLEEIFRKLTSGE